MHVYRKSEKRGVKRRAPSVDGLIYIIDNPTFGQF